MELHVLLLTFCVSLQYRYWVFKVINVSMIIKLQIMLGSDIQCAIKILVVW